MSRRNISHVYTVRGVTDNLRRLSAHFGVGYQTAHSRLTQIGWSLEQALGLVPPPPRRRSGGRGCHLPAGPRLASAEENLLAAMLTPMSAEEYLRREGVPLNDHPLPGGDHEESVSR